MVGINHPNKLLKAFLNDTHIRMLCYFTILSDAVLNNMIQRCADTGTHESDVMFLRKEE